MKTYKHIVYFSLVFSIHSKLFSTFTYVHNMCHGWKCFMVIKAVNWTAVWYSIGFIYLTSALLGIWAVSLFVIIWIITPCALLCTWKGFTKVFFNKGTQLLGNITRMFNFTRKCHNVLQYSCSHFHSNLNGMNVPAVSYPG
jgi:hypothetical protein